MRRRLRECFCIRQLAAEVESTDKGEHFAEGQFSLPEADGVGKISVIAENEHRANAADIRRREEKDLFA